MNKEEFDKFVDDKEWVFAKTYAKFAPHWYIALSKVGYEYKNDFIEAANFIRINGHKVRFYSKDYICFDSGGYRYWTMDEDINDTDLINRAKN